jgi:hypothetical protein
MYHDCINTDLHLLLLVMLYAVGRKWNEISVYN